MRLHFLRGGLLVLAALTPTTAVRPTEPTAQSPTAEFAGSFAGFSELPASAPSQDAVDVSTIEHSHPGEEDVARLIGSGSASFYAAKFHGRRTASGEAFDNGALTAAHRTLPFGSRVRVTNRTNGKSVVVRINDRGPFTAGRVIDVSRAAAVKLGMVAQGHGKVDLALVD